jgi:hypothetical protein
MSVVTCTSKINYYDYKLSEINPFLCDQERLEDKDLCLFYEESYLKDHNYPENKETVIEKLYKIIEESI